MIDTLFFALQIIGVCVLLGWAVIHDKLEDGDPVRGPLAFKQPDADSSERRKRSTIASRRKAGSTLQRR